MLGIQETSINPKEEFFQLITKSEIIKEDYDRIKSIIKENLNIINKKKNVSKIVIRNKELGKEYVFPIILFSIYKNDYSQQNFSTIFKKTWVRYEKCEKCENILGSKWENLEDPFLHPIEIAFLFGKLELAEIY